MDNNSLADILLEYIMTWCVNFFFVQGCDLWEGCGRQSTEGPDLHLPIFRWGEQRSPWIRRRCGCNNRPRTRSQLRNGTWWPWPMSMSSIEMYHVPRLEHPRSTISVVFLFDWSNPWNLLTTYGSLFEESAEEGRGPFMWEWSCRRRRTVWLWSRASVRHKML